MALISCPNCGKTISDKAASCVSCGYTLQTDQPQIKYEEKPIVGSNIDERNDISEINDTSKIIATVNTETKSKSKKPFIIICISLFVIAGLIFGGILLFKEKKVKVKSIEIRNLPSSMIIGDERKIYAQPSPSEAKPDITFTSSDPEVLSIDAEGNIKALNDGTVNITATADNNVNAIETVTICTIVGDWKAEFITQSDSDIVITADDSYLVASTHFKCDGKEATLSGYDFSDVKGAISGPFYYSGSEYQTYTMSTYSDSCNVSIISRDEIAVWMGELIIFFERK